MTVGSRSRFRSPKVLPFSLVLKTLLLLYLVLMAHASLAQKQSVDNLRIWHSPERTRIVFDVSASLEYRTFTLIDPKRLVVDLEETDLSVTLPEVKGDNRHLSAVRYGNPKDGVLRVVFDLKMDVHVTAFILTPNELYGHRLVIDLKDQKPGGSVVGVGDASEGVAESLATQSGEIRSSANETSETVSQNQNAAPTPVVVNQPAPANERFIVAIDAGHGGDDPGALGYRGTMEKKLTLAISKALAKRINQNPKMKAVLVRTGDYYLSLKDRRQRAKRLLGADVFLSIHADAFTKKSARGMSVFALSQRGATSAMARTLAAKENASDLIGGVSLSDKDEVLRKVLVDLSMTNTISESVNLGGRVLKELQKLGHLHSKRVEQANFSVLRSPDVPSILIETGFITNPDDERRLRSSRHQKKLAEAIYLAVNEYYEQTPYASAARYDSPSIGGGTPRASASVTYGRHKVVRGDTLSDIAAKYGISLRELKRLNNLRHNTAMLGVRLKVPLKSNGRVLPSASNAKGSTTHRVGRGDSLSKISLRYNVTINAIKRANNLTSNRLREGQRLTIPGVTPTPLTHKVRRGDTLSEIAQQYGSTIAKIKKANNLRSSTVRLGQVLSIPR